MVLDNCPSELHSSLASKVSAVGTKVKLITVEYDIRDDKPQTTEVIHIEAIGPEVAEELLIRRFPSIGQANARRIAEFANGNARVALAIAERVGKVRVWPNFLTHNCLTACLTSVIIQTKICENRLK